MILWDQIRNKQNWTFQFWTLNWYGHVGYSDPHWFIRSCLTPESTVWFVYPNHANTGGFANVWYSNGWVYLDAILIFFPFKYLATCYTDKWLGLFGCHLNFFYLNTWPLAIRTLLVIWIPKVWYSDRSVVLRTPVYVAHLKKRRQLVQVSCCCAWVNESSLKKKLS